MPRDQEADADRRGGAAPAAGQTGGGEQRGGRCEEASAADAPDCKEGPRYNAGVKVSRPAPAAFTVEFESEEELRREYEANLNAGGLRLPTDEKLPLFAPLALTLRLAGRGEAAVKAQAVGILPGAVALAFEGKPAELLEALLTEPVVEAPGREVRENVWDKMRGLGHVEKLMLAPKADRSERAILMQDTDPQVLLALLKNPRITLDEIVRIAKSTALSFQMADQIMRTQQLIAPMDVKVALIHNPKTPVQFALRLLPGMPEAELKILARSASSQALKVAALKKLQAS